MMVPVNPPTTYAPPPALMISDGGAVGEATSSRLGENSDSPPLSRSPLQLQLDCVPTMIRQASGGGHGGERFPCSPTMIRQASGGGGRGGERFPCSPTMIRQASGGEMELEAADACPSPKHL